MEYVKLQPKCELNIENIISIHYFEYAKDFAFSGEMHDFWELVYVDHDELFVTAGGNEFLLKAGQMYFHKPMEFHNIRCNGEVPASSVIASFSSDCPLLFSLAGKIIDCGKHERWLMAEMISEAQGAFSTPLGDPYTAELIRKDTPDRFAGEQLIKNYLESLCIGLIRKSENNGSERSVIETDHTGEKLGEILSYLQENVEGRLEFREICEHFEMSASYLKKFFSNEVGCGVMDYYNRCKIDRAKRMIRERELNVSQIADRLCFNSVQYFSRCFRNHTGMTPTEYRESVISMVK